MRISSIKIQHFCFLICLVILIPMAIILWSHSIFGSIAKTNRDWFLARNCFKDPHTYKVHKIINKLSGDDNLTSFLYRCSIESEVVHEPHNCLLVWHDNSLDMKWFNLNSKQPPNLHYIPLEYDTIFAETPIAWWWNGFRNPHHVFDRYDTSDGLRIAILYKYGGRYTDSDFIHLNGSMKNLDINLAYESQKSIGNAFMKFEANDPFLLSLMWRFLIHFNTDFGSQGPKIVRENYGMWINNALYKLGSNVTVGTHETVYPLDYSQFQRFFRNTSSTDKMWDKIDKAKMIHIWNKMRVQSKQVVKLEREALLVQLMERHCPSTHGLMLCGLFREC